MKTLHISEIFYSIQGESTHSGRPCAFVRLCGCNLRCTYCDTRYAYEGGKEMTLEEIIEKVESYRCSLVEITGGEPLLQEQTPHLIKRLLEKDMEVLMETNGSMDIDRVDERCTRIMDIKCPSSGESGKNDFGNLMRLTPIDQVKFVIGNRNDYGYAKNIMRLIPPWVRGSNVLLSCVFGKLDVATLARWILDDRLPARLQIQLHKVLWPEAERGA
jgi:7-carboxy-7-deazaguanine synthase